MTCIRVACPIQSNGGIERIFPSRAGYSQHQRRGTFHLMSAAIVVASPAASAASKRGRHVGPNSRNFGQLGLSPVVGVWYVPFLVRQLGPAAYGLIPLASSLTSYMALITLGINSAVRRYPDHRSGARRSSEGKRIFNTSFWGASRSPRYWSARGFWHHLSRFVDQRAGGLRY